MKCIPIPGGFVCGPRTPRKRCSTPGCDGTATGLCDWPVTRKGKEATCDAKLCDRCRQRQEDPDRDFCPPHQRLSKGAQPALQEAPSRGDCRIHSETGTRLYVVSVGEHGGTQHVTFARNPPDQRGRCMGVMQTVPLDKWLAKTRTP